MNAKILLVTTVPYSSAARLAGAFGVLGAHVEAVFPQGHPLAFCRYLDRAFCYRPLSADASLIKAIGDAAPDFVIPCDDRAVKLLVGLKQFGSLRERSFGPLAAYATLLARAPSMAAARDLGIAGPLTLAVDNLDALPEALQQVGLPCVMKADLSWGGSGVRFVCSAAEAGRAFAQLQGPPSQLRSLLRAVKRKDLHYLDAARNPVKAVVNLQALVIGTPATSVFAAKDGKVLAAQHMDVVSWAGDAGPARLMARVQDPVMDAAAAKIAARFALNGLHGLDFMRDSAGVPQLIEINPRATQICHLPLDGDLPAALLGLPPRPPVTDRKQIALFPQLLAAEDLPSGAFRDIPWDDPRVLRALAGDALPEAAGLEAIGEFERPLARALRR
jgi:hypothetical protein